MISIYEYKFSLSPQSLHDFLVSEIIVQIVKGKNKQK